MSYTPEGQVSLSVSAASKADSWEGDLLVLLSFQQEDKEAFAVLAGAGAEAADNALEGAAADIISTQEFKVREGGGRDMMRLKKKCAPRSLSRRRQIICLVMRGTGPDHFGVCWHSTTFLPLLSTC